MGVTVQNSGKKNGRLHVIGPDSWDVNISLSI